MKKTKWLVFALAALSALPVSRLDAQQAVVRSGEHASFSRLVIDLPKRVPWTLRGTGKNREVMFQGAATAVDVSRAFDRISETRLASITALNGGAGVQLGLKCDCEVEVFWHGTTMLVIDIHDAGAAVSGQQNANAGAINARPPVSPLPSMLSAAPLGGAQNTAAGLTSAYLESDPVSLPRRTAAQSDAINQARESITTGMARAATLGLIDAEVGPAKARDIAEVSQPEPDDAAKQSRQAATLAHPQINLGTYTSADPEIMPRAAKALQNVAGQPCVASALMEIGNWGTSAAFSEQIGSARQALTEEFDRYRPGAILELARLYLYFGFGAEARQILQTRGAELIGPERHAAEIARAMAQLIDFEQTDSAIFADQMECDSDAALWSLLSSGRIEPNQLPNIDAILRALADYPDHLKTHLGARAARIFLAANQVGSAGRILRLLDRQPGPQSAQHALARAETDFASGNMTSADHGLKEVVAANSDASAAALIHRIDTRLRAGEPVPSDMADLAGAYRQEQRSTAVGPELTRVYISALAAAGHYKLAFKGLTAERAADSTPSFEQMADTVAAYTTANASDLTFLRYLMPVHGSPLASFSDTTANRIAKRLIDLGFPAEAQIYLTAAAHGEAMDERRMLRAQINLAQGAPRAAMADLLGLTGPDADLLKAGALSQLGEHRAAHLLYLSVGKTEEALHEALLAEDWSKPQESADLALTSSPDAAEDQPPADPPGALARSRALIEQSVAARENIAHLLEPGADSDGSEQ